LPKESGGVFNNVSLGEAKVKFWFVVLFIFVVGWGVAEQGLKLGALHLLGRCSSI
jgi:hypothetical protein